MPGLEPGIHAPNSTVWMEMEYDGPMPITLRHSSDGGYFRRGGLLLSMTTHLRWVAAEGGLRSLTKAIRSPMLAAKR
jgi:hypothetical protein